MKTPEISIVHVGVESPLFGAVISLHAQNKMTLGLFPRGAFEEHASHGRLLGGIGPTGSLEGYLLYRVAKSRAAIVHLTTAKSSRGSGVARSLIDRLKAETKHLLGISLRCRRDYALAPMWSEFGFTVRDSKAGRGADGALLDYWWFDHNHADLFSLAADRDDYLTGVLVAVDANVFYDLTCPSRPDAEDSGVLQADWVQDSITLCITPELYNEIHRSSDESEKRLARTAAQTFRELKTQERRVRAVQEELTLMFGGEQIGRHQSDIRQIAHAITADVPFLLTRDKRMLDRGDAVFERYGLRILHPVDLLNRFDAFRREAEYRPASLEGSSWRARLVVATDVPRIVVDFRADQEERIGAFQRIVRHYIAQTETSASRLIVDDGDRPVVYFVTVNQGQLLEIPLLRHTEHALAGTLIRHILHELTRRESPQHTVIFVADPQLSREARIALEELGFLPDQTGWWKCSVVGVLDVCDLEKEIGAARIPADLKGKLLADCCDPSRMTAERISALERAFSPVKIRFNKTPSFVVSIRPEWAAHFFDIPVGGQLIMDLNERLHLGIEGAYYCSAKNSHLAAPGRILWYVSKGRTGTGAMSIKACSHLDEVMIGPPKELYRRLRHLGVYDWTNVFDAARRDLSRNLMAFRFSRTERFAKPVDHSEMVAAGIPQPQNPRRITDEQFGKIYRLGMEIHT